MAVRKLLQDLDCQGVQLLNSPTIITPTIASFANANHQHVNAAGGGQLAETSLTLADVTTNNATTGRHGFCPKFPGHVAGEAYTFLADDGAFWPAALSALSANIASASATIDFTNIDASYNLYLIVIDGMRPATDAVNFWLRISTDNGATWKAGASDYNWIASDHIINSGPMSSDSTGAAQIELMDNGDNNHRLGNASDEQSHWKIWITNPGDPNKKCPIKWEGVFLGSGSTTYPAGIANGMGYYKTAGSINGLRFMMSSGNIAEGVFRLFGVA